MARSGPDGTSDPDAYPARLAAAAIGHIRHRGGCAGTSATPTAPSPVRPQTPDVVITDALDRAYDRGYAHGMQAAWLESSTAAEQKYETAVRLIAEVPRHHDEEHPRPSRYCDRAPCRTAWEADRDLRV